MAYKGKGKSKGNSGNDMRKRAPNVTATTQSLGQENYLLDNSDPKNQSTLDTGIKSGLTSLTLQGTTNSGHYNPLYTYNGVFDVTGHNDTWAESVVNNVIYPWYKNVLQAAINYNFDFTPDDFKEYFDTVSKGLQMYYTIDTVIAYTANPASQNIAMEYIRDDITTDIHLKLMLLKERLQACVIPPNMAQIIYWLYQHYGHSDLPGTPIVKFNFGGLWLEGQTTGGDTQSIYGGLTEATIDAMLQSLLDLSTSNIGAVMTQVFKPWVINEIPESQPFATYDPNWLTLYSNLTPVTYISAVGRCEPAVSYDASDNQHFCTFTNSLDGAVVALFNPSITTNDVNEVFRFGSNFILPMGAYFNADDFLPIDGMVNNATNRQRYNTQAGVPGFSSVNSIWHQANAGWCNVLDFSSGSAVNQLFTPECSQMVYDMTVYNQRQAQTDFIRFMFQIGSLKSD